MMDELPYCPFCDPDSERVMILENEVVFSTYDKFPVSEGHALIIPKRHCSNYFDLTSDEQISCWQMVNDVKTILQEKCNPDGYNVGINVNEVAGQTISHVHIHVIPRYVGDVKNPEGGVRGVIPEKRMYTNTVLNNPVRKIDRIKSFLNEINEERVEKISNEIHQKELRLINTAKNGSLFDTTHTEMVLDYIRDNKNPIRPETLNKLMIQLISSALSYNRIRKQFRKINRIVFNDSNFPIKEDNKKILAYLLSEERFNDEYYWHPDKFEVLIKEIDNKGGYKKLKILSDYWLEHVMDVFRSAPARMIELTSNNLNGFYNKIDDICTQDYRQDIFKKAEALWKFATELSRGIKNVGTNLMCDFLKESGFTDYAKMDIHMIRIMNDFLQEKNSIILNDYETFVSTLWLADKIQMSSFRLDKILYVDGIYRLIK